VIRELKGEPIVAAQEQIQQGREEWRRDPDSSRGHHDVQSCGRSYPDASTSDRGSMMVLRPLGAG
jgi:hypothetical protein